MRFRSAELVLSLIVALVLCAPGVSMGQGLSDDTLPTETACDPGDVFVPDPTGLGLLWAADDGDFFSGCGPGIPLPVCNMSLPNDLFCDLDAVTFDVTQHPQVPPPVSISLDDGDPSPNGPPLSNFVELLDVLPPGPPVAALTEAGLLLLNNPPPEGADDDVDGFETNMIASMLPHPGGYFFDFSTDQDNPCGLDSGDIYFAICPSFTLFCDDVTEILIPDDCDIDALHNIQPSQPFPSGFSSPQIGSWGYLFSIDANSGPNCLLTLDPGDIYYTECSKGTGLPPFPGFTLWADDVADLGMAGCDGPNAHIQNDPTYCDIDAISVVITTTTTTTTVTLPTTTTTVTLPATTTTVTLPATTTTITAPPTTTTSTTTSTTTTTTLAPVCAVAPIGGCVGPEKAILLVKEKVAGKEKVKAVIKKLKLATSQGDFGDPVGGTTSYTVCIYDDGDTLVGQMVVARAGQDCGTPARPCWKALSTKGYKYKDKDTSADGILKIIAKAGDPGKGKLILLGKNNAAKGQNSLPTAIAPALAGNTKATVQVVTSDANCFGVTTDQVKKADADLFKALGGSPSAAFLDMGSGLLD